MYSEKRKISNKIWREKNKERLRILRRENYLNNKERDLSRSKIHYQENKEQYKNNQIKNRDHIRDTRFKKHYGIGLDEYNKILIKQNNVCVICRSPETMIDSRNGKTRALAVDHNHKTSKVRGLLCRRCNNGIGIFNEDLKLLESVKVYLQYYE
jgi:hypothetical protein